jgi:hypothetical protein
MSDQITVATFVNHPAILGREEARVLGLKRFFTGEPCGHGHIAEHYVRSGGCLKCSSEQSAKYRATNPEEKRKRDREHARKHRAKDPEGFREYCRRWRAGNRQKIREYARMWRTAQRRAAITNEGGMPGA